MIKAIETVYKGYKFRSRLEARWAVFFDAFGIEYVYEPEGFEKNGVKYLPDFYLPESKTFVEVKGVLSSVDAKKLAAMLDYGPVFHCDDSDYHAAGLLMLGDIPNYESGLVLHPLITHRKGLLKRWAVFSGGRLIKVSDGYVNCAELFSRNLAATQRALKEAFLDGCGSDDNEKKEFFSTSPIATINTYVYTKNNKGLMASEAYAKARQARFEYGERL